MSYTLHVIPVGVSLGNRLDPASDKYEYVAESAAIHPHGSVRDALNRHRKLDGTLDAVSLLHDDHARAAALLDGLVEMQVDWCAEWNALDKYSAATGTSASSDTAYVFIASDTDAGLRSAALASIGFAAEHTLPVLYIDDPSRTLSAPVARGVVHLVRAPKLDPEKWNDYDSVQTMGRALGKLGAVLARTALTNTDEQWTVVFHLTGGYKAMLPHFLTLADSVQTVLMATRGRDCEAKAFALHEDTEVPLELPVRCLHAGALSVARGLTASIGDDVVVNSPSYEGLVGQFLTDDQPRRLNLAGMILTGTLCVLPAG